MFILLARWFNPAGINSDRETVLLSCFELREQGGEASQPRSETRHPSQRQQPDEDIPF